MPVLHVDLQEGFEAEPVVVAVNGREVFRKTAVSTRTQIGLADSFELTLPPGDTSVEVLARDARARFNIALHDTTYLGVSITPDAEIVHQVSRQAFGYL